MLHRSLRRRLLATWTTGDGKKLPREVVAAMQDDGCGEQLQASMRRATEGQNEEEEEGRAPRLRAWTRSDLAGERLALYDRLRADRSKTGDKAGFAAVNADGSLAGPWNAYVAASPAIGAALDRLAHACRHANACPAQLYEVAILAVAAHHRSDFEWFAHEKLALDAGVSPETCHHIRRRPNAAADFPGTQRQSAVYDYARALVEQGRATHVRTLAALGSEAALVDLVTTIGLYTHLALLLAAFHVPLPPNVQRPFDDADANDGASS